MNLFSPNGRTSQIPFLLTALVAVTLEVFAVLAVDEWLPQSEGEGKFLALALVALPFAWVMSCNDIRRLQDLGWSWAAEVPVVPLYFWSVGPMVLSPEIPAVRVLLYALGLYAVGFWAMLLVRPGIKAIEKAPPPKTSGVPLPVPPMPPPVQEIAPEAAPITGWLVVTEGPARGQDFPLLAGRNRIGRDASMDVSIDDPAVRDSNHASVYYDPLNNRFGLVPGGPQDTVVLNGVAVDKASPLETYDSIRVGGTVLVFVALCGPEFKWE